MRRKDREITDFTEIIEIFEKNNVLRLGLCDANIPYVVPLTYAYEIINDKVVLYFHSAKEGRKIDLINKNANVCIEIDSWHELVQGEKACDYSYKYESLIGEGKAELIDKPSEKLHAMEVIMKKVAKNDKTVFNDQMLQAVCLVKIELSSVSGKRKADF